MSQGSHQDARDDLNPSQWAKWAASTGAKPVDLGTVPCGICGERVRIGMNGMWSQYHDCKPVPLARLQQAERERDEARETARAALSDASRQAERAQEAEAGWASARRTNCEYNRALAERERERDEARAEVARLRHDPKADASQVIEEWRAKAERAWSDAGQAQERLDQAVALLREARTVVAAGVLLHHMPNAVDLLRRLSDFIDGQPAQDKPDHEREAMARVCEAAQARVETYDKGEDYTGGIKSVEWDNLRRALADLDRARKGEG